MRKSAQLRWQNGPGSLAGASGQRRSGIGDRMHAGVAQTDQVTTAIGVSFTKPRSG